MRTISTILSRALSDLLSPKMELQFWIRILSLLPALHLGYCVLGMGYSFRWECDHTYGNTLSSHSSVVSDLSCAVACEQEDRCLSALYNPTSKECLTNSDTSGFVDETGTCNPLMKYLAVSKRYCVTNADCPDTTNGECADNFCQCVNGYSLTPATGICSTSCSTYGDTFRVFPSTRMAGSNHRKAWNNSISACQEVCVRETGFLCRSVEFDSSIVYCLLSTKTAYTKPSSIVYDDPSRSYMHRNCA